MSTFAVRASSHVAVVERSTRDVFEPDLREVHLGTWEGGLFRKHDAERHPLARRLWREERWDLIPGAEPADAFSGTGRH